jgi:hypothetical protein
MLTTRNCLPKDISIQPIVVTGLNSLVSRGSVPWGGSFVPIATACCQKCSRVGGME